MNSKSMTVITKMHGDYWQVEAEQGLLDEPHPFDPNRIAALPLGGYGWPTEDAALVLKYRLYGFKPTELERRRTERENRKKAETEKWERWAASQERHALEKELLLQRKLISLRERALRAMGVAV